MTQDNVLTIDEICKRFNEADLDAEFIGEVLGRLTGYVQAMHNLTTEPEKYAKLVDTYGDYFQEAHNEVVTMYQRYHN